MGHRRTTSPGPSGEAASRTRGTHASVPPRRAGGRDRTSMTATPPCGRPRATHAGTSVAVASVAGTSMVGTSVRRWGGVRRADARAGGPSADVDDVAGAEGVRAVGAVDQQPAAVVDSGGRPAEHVIAGKLDPDPPPHRRAHLLVRLP